MIGLFHSFVISNNYTNFYSINTNSNLEYKSDIYNIMLNYRYKLKCYYDIKYVNILQDIVDKLEKGIGT